MPTVQFGDQRSGLVLPGGWQCQHPVRRPDLHAPSAILLELIAPPRLPDAIAWPRPCCAQRQQRHAAESHCRPAGERRRRSGARRCLNAQAMNLSKLSAPTAATRALKMWSAAMWSAPPSVAPRLRACLLGEMIGSSGAARSQQPDQQGELSSTERKGRYETGNG